MLSVGVKVMWMARCKYSSDHFPTLHSHNFYHYIYVVDGSGEIEIDGKEYILKKKHLYMTPSNASHCFAASDNGTFQAIEIKFSLLDSSMIEKANQLPHQVADDKLAIEKSLELMLEEGVEKYGLYTDIINIKFSEILLYLIKNNTARRGMSKGSKINSYTQGKDSYFEPVITYMSENLHLPIDLSTLSCIMHLNKSYFCKLFTSKYGVSPIHFLNDMRISKAKKLLQDSAMNITEIACETGFKSVHYFSRFFTQKEGITPYEYRQKSKGDIYLYLDQDFSKIL